ncbi:unnamed protein product [Prunus armeniaca]|uniref:Disease resistance protein winged helix domain-containing protein n=1 Tax=Prunus armeniaca TaxID=36596 RepID=A0A6J5Y5Z6_PRUAR|nr:unnamed protein product [Prunus armeniaca]
MAKCDGLPLVVVVLGGLLSTKRKTVEEGRHMLQNITWHLIDQDRVSAILALSYNDLPFHLESCFLHLGLFPEDSSISKIKLIHLWVAEKFLPQQGEELVEGVAENCLNELVDSGQQVASPALQRNKSRRLAIHGEHDLFVFLKPYASYIRSLQYFNVGYLKNGFIYKDLKLLRVLDGVPFPSQALSAVGNLIQLSYLRLSLIQVPFRFQLPRSIGKLKNLQTLKVESNYENFQ